MAQLRCDLLAVRPPGSEVNAAEKGISSLRCSEIVDNRECARARISVSDLLGHDIM